MSELQSQNRGLNNKCRESNINTNINNENIIIIMSICY